MGQQNNSGTSNGGQSNGGTIGQTNGTIGQSSGTTEKTKSCKFVSPDIEAVIRELEESDTAPSKKTKKNQKKRMKRKLAKQGVCTPDLQETTATQQKDELILHHSVEPSSQPLSSVEVPPPIPPSIPHSIPPSTPNVPPPAVTPSDSFSSKPELGPMPSPPFVRHRLKPRGSDPHLLSSYCKNGNVADDEYLYTRPPHHYLTYRRKFPNEFRTSGPGETFLLPFTTYLKSEDEGSSDGDDRGTAILLSRRVSENQSSTLSGHSPIGNHHSVEEQQPALHPKIPLTTVMTVEGPVELKLVLGQFIFYLSS